MTKFFTVFILTVCAVSAKDYAGRWVSKEITVHNRMASIGKGWVLILKKDGTFEEKKDTGFNVVEESAGTYSIKDGVLELVYKWHTPGRGLTFDLSEDGNELTLVHRFKAEKLYAVTFIKSEKDHPVLKEMPPVPTSIKEAVSTLKKLVAKKDLDYIRFKRRDGLVQFHHGFGTYIRNAFGLWKGNPKLCKELMIHTNGSNHPDDMSMIIIECLWDDLNAHEMPKFPTTSVKDYFEAIHTYLRKVQQNKDLKGLRFVPWWVLRPDRCWPRGEYLKGSSAEQVLALAKRRKDLRYLAMLFLAELKNGRYKLSFYESGLGTKTIIPIPKFAMQTDELEGGETEKIDWAGLTEADVALTCLSNSLGMEIESEKEYRGIKACIDEEPLLQWSVAKEIGPKELAELQKNPRLWLRLVLLTDRWLVVETFDTKYRLTEAGLRMLEATVDKSTLAAALNENHASDDSENPAVALLLKQIIGKQSPRQLLDSLKQIKKDAHDQKVKSFWNLAVLPGMQTNRKLRIRPYAFYAETVMRHKRYDMLKIGKDAELWNICQSYFFEAVKQNTTKRNKADGLNLGGLSSWGDEDYLSERFWARQLPLTNNKKAGELMETWFTQKNGTLANAVREEMLKAFELGHPKNYEVIVTNWYLSLCKQEPTDNARMRTVRDVLLGDSGKQELWAKIAKRPGFKAPKDDHDELGDESLEL